MSLATKKKCSASLQICVKGEVSKLLCLMAFDPTAFSFLAIYLRIHRYMCIFWTIAFHWLISKRVGGNEL